MKPITTGVLLMGDLPAKDLASLARKVEDWGYDYIWLADERFFREVYSSLTLCALNATKIRLGVCVTDPYSRHPALTAMAISTVDEISEGRAVLGIGAGVSGFGELGIDRSRPALAMREMISLVRELMSGQQVDFRVRTVTFREGMLNFTPPRADLPIYVASNPPRGLRLAGELAQGAIVSNCIIEETVDYALAWSPKGPPGPAVTRLSWTWWPGSTVASLLTRWRPGTPSGPLLPERCQAPLTLSLLQASTFQESWQLPSGRWATPTTKRSWPAWTAENRIISWTLWP